MAASCRKLTVDDTVRRRQYDAAFSCLCTPVCEGRSDEMSAEEITDRRRRAQDDVLQEANERLNQLTEQSSTFIWEVDADGLYTYVSDYVMTALGYRPEEIVGRRHFYDFHPEEGRAGFKAGAMAVFGQKVSFVGLLNAVETKDGRVLWFSTNGLPLIAPDGTLKGYRGSDLDITEKRAAEEALKNSEQKYRLLTENLSDVVWVLDLESMAFTYISPSIQKRTGHTAGEAMARTLSETMTRESHDDFRRSIVEALRHFTLDPDGSWEDVVEVQLVRRDGSLIWEEISLKCRCNAESRVEVIGAGRQIEERKQAQRNERAAKAEIEELNRRIRESLEEQVELRTDELKAAMARLMEREKMASLGSLVSGIAHEINTPLGVGVSTTSYMEVLNRENRERLTSGTMSREDLLGFMENMDESLRILSRNLDRAAELIKSFKQIAVTQSHELLSKFRVLEYVQAVLVSLKHEYRHMSIRIDVACPEDLTVFSYPGALSQILTNLVMNSLIHGFRNRDAGVIRVTVADRGEVFEITYSDDGVGILPENLSRIYDPFFTTNREHGGSGLGMNIVYNIVTDQLKGTIECVSFPERGTTFVLRIPNGRNGENDGQ